MLKQIDDRVLLVRVGDLLTQMLPYSAAVTYSFTPNSNSP